jgi:hypothetical protein
MGLIVEFTGGRRCTACGGWIDPARVRIFARAVVCEPCRNLRRRASASSSGAKRRGLHLVPPEAEEVIGPLPRNDLAEIPVD